MQKCPTYLTLLKLWPFVYSLDKTHIMEFLLWSLAKISAFVPQSISPWKLIEIVIIWIVVVVFYHVKHDNMTRLKECDHSLFLVVIFYSFEEWWLINCMSFIFHLSSSALSRVQLKRSNSDTDRKSVV